MRMGHREQLRGLNRGSVPPSGVAPQGEGGDLEPPPDGPVPPMTPMTPPKKKKRERRGIHK